MVDDQNLLLRKQEQGNRKVANSKCYIDSAKQNKVRKREQHRKNNRSDTQNQTGHQCADQISSFLQRLSTMTIGSQGFELESEMNTVKSVFTEKAPGNAMDQLMYKDGGL